MNKRSRHLVPGVWMNTRSRHLAPEVWMNKRSRHLAPGVWMNKRHRHLAVGVRHASPLLVHSSANLAPLTQRARPAGAAVYRIFSTGDFDRLPGLLMSSRYLWTIDAKPENLDW